MITKKIMKCFDAFIYDRQTGELVGMSENNTSSSLAGTATENAIKNGRNNSDWTVLSSSKELTLELASNVLDFNMIAVNMGTRLIKDGTIFNTDAETQTVKAGKLTLKESPLNKDKLILIQVEGDKILEVTKDYTVTDTEITVTAITGDIRILPYEYTTVGVEEIVISADKFAEAFRVLLKTVAIDSNSNVTDFVEIEIDKCRPNADFNIGSSADFTSGNDTTTTYKCLVDNKGNLATMRFLPIK